MQKKPALIFFLGLHLPFDGGERGWGNGLNLREFWRAQGGPIWCLLLMYFTLCWTALKWVSLARPDGQSGVSTESVLDR